MPTRRWFLQKLPVIAGVATLTDSKTLSEQLRRRRFLSSSKRPSRRVVIYIALSEKNRLDYSYKRPVTTPSEETFLDRPFQRVVATINESSVSVQECSKKSHGKLRLRSSKAPNSRRYYAAVARAQQKSTPGEKDIFVLSALMTTDVKGLMGELPALRAVKFKASKTKQPLRKHIYQEIASIPSDYKKGFEVYEVFLEKSRITARYKTRCESVNRGLLYTKLMEVLLESCDLKRFNGVMVFPDSKVIRNVSKKSLRKRFLNSLQKVPSRRFEIHSVERSSHAGLKLATFVNHALLQGHQPYPLPGQHLQSHALIRKFVKKKVDAAGLI